ncbi:hypothetical protein [Actinophytocola sp. NPDC049390]|uniref:hypothetical protein n=1 Tax=Actinophytocola sp. NPDC049390 TaxID=3363894 RepID=UPI0037B302FD
MTYPQPPGQQPYGQQPGWPPAPGPGGGYQQHGQFPPGGQYPDGPYPGGPQPQKKGNAGLVAGLGVAVVALVVFTITAFVAPGFLLGDDDSGGTAGSGGTATSAGEETGGCGTGGATDPDGMDDGSAQKVKALISKIVQGFCDQDQEALTQLICTGSEPAIRGYVEEADLVEEFELRGEIDDAGPTATARARAVLADGTKRVDADMIITVAYEGSDFCWKDMAEA